MKHIKKFNLDESFGISTQQYGMNLSSAFGYSDLSTVNAGTNQPIDPDLSFDAQDTFKNNLKDKINRFVGIGKKIFNNGNYNFGYDFISEIEDLYIVKMFKNNNGLLDIYIKFTLQEELYYGKFEDWGGINKPVFTSKVLYLPIINGFKDNTIRLIGLLSETLNKWFTPKEDAYYIALKEVVVYTNIGTQYTIPIGGKVLIDDAIIKDNKPLVFLEYKENIYTFSGLDYYLFNWWFKKEDKKEYYI